MSRPRPILAGSIALAIAVAMLTGCNTSTSSTSTPEPSVSSSKAPENVSEDRVDPVRTAKDEQVSAVEAVPDDVTLSQAVASLRNEAANVQAAFSDLQTEATW